MTPQELWESCREQAISMALKRAKKYPHISPDDLVQAALLGLWNAALKFEDDLSGVPFAAYAVVAIRRELTNEFYRHSFFGLSAGLKWSRGCYDFPDDELPLWGKSTVSISAVPNGESSRDNLTPFIDTGMDEVESKDFIKTVVNRMRVQNLSSTRNGLVVNNAERIRTIARRFYVEGLSRETIKHQLGLSVGRFDHLFGLMQRVFMKTAETMKKEMEDDSNR